MMKLESIAIFRLKINIKNIKKMKVVPHQMKVSLLQQSFQIGNHVTFRSFSAIARYLFSHCCNSFQMAGSISSFKILNFWSKTVKFDTTK